MHFLYDGMLVDRAFKLQVEPYDDMAKYRPAHWVSGSEITYIGHPDTDAELAWSRRNDAAWRERPLTLLRFEEGDMLWNGHHRLLATYMVSPLDVDPIFQARIIDLRGQ